MKLPTFLQKKNAASTEVSTAPTVAPSISTSSASDIEKPPVDPEHEKTSPAVADVAATDGTGAKTVEETAVQEAAALDKLSDEPEYPKGAKLGIITAALCLSVFLMALVSGPLRSVSSISNLSHSPFYECFRIGILVQSFIFKSLDGEITSRANMELG